MAGEESTTPDLVERVRVILEAADRADFDTILAFYARDAVWIMADTDLTFEGVDAIRRFWEEWYGSYEDFRVDPPEIIDFGDGVVLAVIRQGGRPGGGSAELREDLALVYEWSEGSVVRVTMSSRLDEARAAAERLAQERADG
jgi:ketosteroid isomerase-like protein